MDLGEKIYKLRTENNLSQGDLAEKLDVSRQSVSKWENNTAVPDLDKLIKLCDIFEISLDELTGREIPKQKPNGIIEEIKGIKESLTKIQLIGCILLGAGIICALLPYGALFTPSLIICSIICLTVKKKPWYWCAWVVFLPLLFIMDWAFIQEISIVIEIAFVVVMAIATYKAFKDTEKIISKKKSILILASSTIYDMLYIIFQFIKMGIYDFSGEGIINHGVSIGTVTSGFDYGFINAILMVGVGLSMIGIVCSVKNLKSGNK